MSPSVIAFLFHAPGLRLFTGHRLTAPLLKLNAAALTLTIAAMVAAGVQRGAWAVLITWGIGHFAWSATLAFLVHRSAEYNRPRERL